MSATKHQITPVQAVVITGCSSGMTLSLSFKPILCGQNVGALYSTEGLIVRDMRHRQASLQLSSLLQA